LTAAPAVRYCWKKVMRSRRVHIVALVALAVLCAAGPGAVLFALPLVAIFAALVSGRYVGEERLIALRVRTASPRRRGAAPRWRPARPGVHRSLFAQRPRTFRGPPARFAAL
jgi:hypothetical protein